MQCRFREELVENGQILDIPDDACCVSLQSDRKREMRTVVVWLERV
jgi:hypothetical protein